MAEELNQKGNTSYKAGEFAKAQQFYAQASSVSPEEPKYISNLSAALYEEGKYGESIQSVVRSWQKIQAKVTTGGPNSPPEWDSLYLKLAVRFAKANLHQAANGTSTILHDDAIPSAAANGPVEDYEETQADIEHYVTSKMGSASDTRIKDTIDIWDQWKAIRGQHSSHTAAQCQALVLDAQVRLRALKIYKCASDPTLEHYNFGHDNIHSLLDGIKEGNNVFPVNLDSLDEQERSTALSFLFGGSGDARHVFGTLLDIGVRRDILGGRHSPNVHLTLVDIHPAALARTLVIFELLHRIAGTEDVNKRLKLETTLFYLYMCLAVPDYCNEIITNIAKDLSSAPLTSEHLPQWLHVNTHSTEAILDVLRYWSVPLQKSTKVLIELHSNLFSRNQGRDILRRLPLADPTTTTESYQDSRTEDVIYDRLKVLLPPKPFLHLHPAIARLAGDHKSAAPNIISSAKNEVMKSWKPNPTLFDKTSTEHPMFNEVTGYPMVTMDPFQTLRTLMERNISVDPQATLPFGRAAISIVSTFFRNVIDAIALLGEHLTIEVVNGDAISGLSKLVAGDLGKRPDNFPKTFTRIWLSNVPDYTNGLLNTAVHVLPYHSANSNDAMVPMTLFNCLLNTAAFNSVDDFCYNYTLLRQIDLEKFLGCIFTVPDQNLFGPKLVLKPLPLPRPVSMLASKARLHKWLSHLLLCVLCNGNPLPPPRRVDLPNNLNAFFRLLVHLHTVGFPSHWLGEFVQMVVSDCLVTDMKPYLKRLPIPRSAENNTTAPRKVHLKAWQAELELILATAGPALPFFVAIPKDYPSLDDIHAYRATVKPVDLSQHRFFQVWAPLSSPFVMTAGLIFYEPNADFRAEELAHQVSFILEGDPDLTAVQKQIMLGVEHLDLTKGEVGWRMSKKWYEKMKKEKWQMAVYRTDLAIAASEPLNAASWVEVV